MGAISFCTAAIPQKEQLEYWNELICRRFTLLQCEAEHQRGYRGNLETWDLGPLQLSKVDVDPAGVFHSNSLVADTQSDDMLLHLQVSGASLNTQRSDSQLLSAGHYALCNTTERYAVEFDQPMTMLVAKFPTHEFKRRTGLAPFDVTCSARGVSDFQTSLATQLLLSAWEKREGYGTQTAREALGEALMAAIAAESISRFKDQSNDQSTGAAIYARAELLVTQHLADPELNQSIVAGQLGISTRYLRYLFAERETTFSRYLLERRLQRAERMLRDTGCARGRVSRIAYECGFNNVSHFARVFTAHYGCPPSQIYSGSDAAR